MQWCMEHREECVAEVVACLAMVSRREARERVREAVRKAAALDESVRVEYSWADDALVIACPAGVDDATGRVRRVWDACWDHIKAWAGRLPKAA